MERPIRNPLHPSAATVSINSAAAAGTDLIKSGSLYTPESADARLLAATACLCRLYALTKDAQLMERYARRGLLLVQRSTPKQQSLLLHALSKSVLVPQRNTEISESSSTISLPFLGDCSPAATLRI
ncbi:hypothetical protein cyc_05338 [Cyclospora cayetanensis]|uniref:Uncharacterized protein n=1 Tax=Cyclospora cayetanensis TaxID=88456 RepID=A0A1D3D4L7_9EIME|nr:hypothetical protein cyc_05338 [Cyclospora cayetanensis]